jgi:hypothetical protein
MELSVTSVSPEAAAGQPVRLVLDRAGAHSDIGEHVLKVRVVARIEHLVRRREVGFPKRANMHLADGPDAFNNVRFSLEVRLVGHALVPDPGRARLVGVDARDNKDLVLHLGLDLRQPRNVITHRVLVVR